MVLATQNPIEYEGTFPLPEAQLDRFLMRIHLGYPTATDEVLIMDGQQRQHPIEALERVTQADEILSMQRAVKDVYVDPLIKQYIVEHRGRDAAARARRTWAHRRADRWRCTARRRRGRCWTGATSCCRTT